MMPRVKEIDHKLKDYLLKQIDHIVRNDEDIEIALNLVDQKFLVEYLGIEELCYQCRLIWKKLQTRRLGRGK